MPCQPGLQACSTGFMFLHHRMTVDLPTMAVVERIVSIWTSGALAESSSDAFESGRGVLEKAAVGPIRKQIAVTALPPHVREDGTVVIALTWAATGPLGELFPVLDANLELARAGKHTTRVDLVGSYRPPGGRIGATIDRTLLRHFAGITARAFLSDLHTRVIEAHGALPERAAASWHADILEVEA